MGGVDSVLVTLMCDNVSVQLLYMYIVLYLETFENIGHMTLYYILICQWVWSVSGCGQFLPSPVGQEWVIALP